MTASAGTVESAVMTVRTGMTGSAGTVESAVMTVRTGMAPEACNSSPGNANRPIGTQAGQEKDRHSNSPRKYVLRHVPGVIPAHTAVTSTLRRHSCEGRNLNANYFL